MPENLRKIKWEKGKEKVRRRGQGEGEGEVCSTGVSSIVLLVEHPKRRDGQLNTLTPIANKRRIALLEKMAEEIYREWFVRMRFPGHQSAKFVKGVPEGWDETNLGRIARFTMGQSPKSEFYNDTGEGLPFHQGVGTYGNRFPNTVNYCSVDGRRADKGDVLFSVRAPVGRLNIADRDMIIGRGLAAIRHADGCNTYLYHLLKTVFANEDIIGNGSIFNSVGKDELSRLSLHGHPKDLIQDFERVARPIDQQIENLIHSTANLTQTRDLLLPRLISGKLSVEDLDILFPPSMRDEPQPANCRDAIPQSAEEKQAPSPRGRGRGVRVGAAK